jgi:hypothetical protein
VITFLVCGLQNFILRCWNLNGIFVPALKNRKGLFCDIRGLICVISELVTETAAGKNYHPRPPDS